MRYRLRLRAAAVDATSSFDVVVLGGGPAGSATAALLARRSHRVALVTLDRPSAGELAESVPPSAWRILEELGFSEAIRAAGHPANRGNTVWWARREARREVFSAERIGVHAERGRLERSLRPAVEARGATLFEGVRARSAERSAGGWTVFCEPARGTPFELRASWLVDATGRHGLMARSLRVPDRRTTTVALTRRWRRRTGWPERLSGHTLVESCDRAWAWSVPTAAAERAFTVMVDGRDTALDDTDLDRMLDRELSHARHLSEQLRGAEPVGPAWACPASLYTAERFAAPGLLLAGDAGSFIDPLSSFGVKKALSSGWLAGIAVHTALTEPEMEDVALEYFDARERAVYHSSRAASADFFREAAEAHGTPYWTRRAEAAHQAATPESVEPQAPADPLEPPLPPSEVQAAFDEIRGRERLRARRGSTVHPVERPAIEGDRLILRPHLASGRVPEGVRYVREVDLWTLVEVVPMHPDVPDGWAAYNRVAPPVTLPDYLTALATAFAAGLLEHDHDGRDQDGARDGSDGARSGGSPPGDAG